MIFIRDLLNLGSRTINFLLPQASLVWGTPCSDCPAFLPSACVLPLGEQRLEETELDLGPRFAAH